MKLITLIQKILVSGEDTTVEVTRFNAEIILEYGSSPCIYVLSKNDLESEVLFLESDEIETLNIPYQQIVYNDTTYYYLIELNYAIEFIADCISLFKKPVNRFTNNDILNISNKFLHYCEYDA